MSNSAATWKNRVSSARMHRRAAEIVRSEAKDLGNRAGVEELFGFGDPRGWVTNWRGLARRWLTR